ncbi:hypothetical protein D9M70_641500 [compost metagenome]
MVFITFPERLMNVVSGGALAAARGYTFRPALSACTPGAGSPFFMKARPNNRFPKVGECTTK